MTRIQAFSLYVFFFILKLLFTRVTSGEMLNYPFVVVFNGPFLIFFSFSTIFLVFVEEPRILSDRTTHQYRSPPWLFGDESILLVSLPDLVQKRPRQDRKLHHLLAILANLTWFLYWLEFWLRFIPTVSSTFLHMSLWG